MCIRDRCHTGGDIAHTGTADLGIHTGAKRHGQQQGGLQLIQIGKGLKEHEVSPGYHACPDDAAILCHGILKRKDVYKRQLPLRHRQP